MKSRPLSAESYEHTLTQMLSINTHSETLLTRGWQWQVLVSNNGHSTAHTVTLSWHDHDHWCGGTLAPSHMVERVLEYCLARMDQIDQPLPPTFDAARARRWFPAIDREIRQTA